MKTIQHILFIAPLAVLSACSGSAPSDREALLESDSSLIREIEIPVGIPEAAKNTIRLALLLDTSNSMDGLIEQAKSQLWKIVNALSEAKKDGEYAQLEIALYEYGNDNLEAGTGYVRQVLPFTHDLDTLSQELFALKTFGGSEYCGEVILQSLDQLTWAEVTEGLQVIVIAGNEAFDQGTTSYQQVCERARGEQIYINTIFCGRELEGIQGYWKDGATIADGYYGMIDMNEATVYIETPYDEEINALNKSLNDTYIPIGRNGSEKIMNMNAQDQNASHYGTANSTERVIVKSKHHVYDNSAWDLVDASKKTDFDLSKIKHEDLPANMQTMTLTEKEKFLEKMATSRASIQQKITELAALRERYLVEKKATTSDENATSLEDAIVNAIKEQAIAKGFVFRV